MAPRAHNAWMSLASRLFVAITISGLVLSTNAADSLVGCFADGPRRSLSTQILPTGLLTVQSCSKEARARGQPVFALARGTECWIGVDLAAAKSVYGPSTECNTPCSGDATQICGGAASVSLYQTDPTVPAPSSDTTATLQGCYADGVGGDRRMTPLWSDDRMTPTFCAMLAKHQGYTVAGLKFHRECWGSNDLTYATALGTSTGCTSDCVGDSALKCGGSNALSIYTLPDFTKLGCFLDSWDRMLPNLLQTSGLMNPARCAGLAKDAGYTVFGIQNSVECRAGNDAARAQSLGASTACTMSCHNAPAGDCGGNLANAVFVVGSNRPASCASCQQGFTAVGCFRDNIADRVLPRLLETDVGMTVDKCAAMAGKEGYNVFGIQWAQTCYAGADEDAAKKHGEATNCNSPCWWHGDGIGSCGGTLATSLYRIGAAVSPPPVTPPPVTPPPVIPPPVTPPPVTPPPVTPPPVTPPPVQPPPLTPQPPVNPPPVNPPPPTNPFPPPGGELVPNTYWTLRGCYRDTMERTVHILLGGDPATMTTAECARRARERYLTIFALQYGGECFGSDDWERSTALAKAPSSKYTLGQIDDNNCNMPCGGAADERCGGPNANILYTIPPPAPPADVPAYTYLGCFTDDQVFDDSHDPPSPTQRRMWRRIGQAVGMDSWECARRAAATGYPLFGITTGEPHPQHGWQCWGAYDEAYVTALGPSTGCVNPCKDYRGADICGGDYAISLYRINGMQYDTGADGEYQYLMEFPISSVHVMQVTGRDEFLLIDFLGSNHPPSWDGRNTTYMWVRENNTARSILNIRDASCGMWIRLPEGDFAGFSGYFGASGVNEYAVWATMLYHRYQHRAEDFGERAMPYGRWYGGAMLLPDGRAYVTGGDMNGPGSPRALGADVWDPAHKTYVGSYNNMGLNEPYLQLNDPLFFASEVGGYYPGMWPLFSGGLLFSQSQTVQVINPSTGAALAAAPRLPRNNYWEYPLSGSQVLLREPTINPNDDVTLWFMVFGGGYQAAFYKPCSDFSLRIRLDIRCSVRPCTHTFGEWEVETMPGHRCMMDTSVLPNGKIMILGGTEEGLSNLDHRPNSCNVPVNEPWIYDPEAPAGRRYRRTGAYTNIARMYHGSHVMTSYGDILLGGSTIAEGFTSYHMRDFSVTPYQWAEFRIELFKPHYILGPRPTWASVPSQIEFASTFTVTLAANTTASDIVAVVLSDQGTTTHSSNHATRTMLLAYTQAGGQSLTVTAPANIHIAQPGFYLLFAVARDDTYSVGRWLRLKGPWGSRPSSLPAPSQFVATASTQFETAAVPWVVNPSGTAAVSLTRTAAAAGSGGFGLSVAAGGAEPIVLSGPALNLAAGTRVSTYLWARGPNNDIVQLQYMLLNSANMPAASYPVDAHADIKVTLINTYQHFTMGGIIVNTTGNYYPALRITGMTAGQTVSLDDIEVFTLTQADAQSSLQQARSGVPVGEQIAPPVAAARRRSTRRLQGDGNDGAWAAAPELPDANEALMKKLEKDLQAKLRTSSGQHATSALAGVTVKGMTHKHHDQAPHEEGMHHQK